MIYVKATLCGQEPIDVLTYGKANPAFPHESTANQWFGEAQFESYRVLGCHAIHQIAEGYRGDGDLGDFFRWVAQQPASAPAAPSAVIVS